MSHDFGGTNSDQGTYGPVGGSTAGSEPTADQGTYGPVGPTSGSEPGMTTTQGPAGPAGPPGPAGPAGPSIDLWAATRIVSQNPDEGTDLTIQEAIDNLPAEGGTIFIKQGVYPIASTIVLPDKSVVFRGAGWGTVLDIGTNPITLFQAPNGLTAVRIYTFEKLKVTGNDGTAQTFFVNLDTNGRGWVTVRDCRIGGSDAVGDGTSIRTIFDYQEYDESYVLPSTVFIENSEISTTPSIPGTTLIKTKNPAGTFNGAVNLTAVNVQFGPASSGGLYPAWLVDLDGDITLSTDCALRVLAGSGCNGFSASESFVSISSGDFTIYGFGWNKTESLVDCFLFGLDGTCRLVSLNNDFCMTGCSVLSVAIQLNGAQRISACELRGNGGAIATGIEVTGDFVAISGCKFSDFGTQDILLNAVDRCSISGCVFNETAARKTIVESVGSNNNIVAGCTGVSTGGGFTLVGANSRCDVLVVNVP